MRITGPSLPEVSCCDISGTSGNHFAIESLIKLGFALLLAGGTAAWGQPQYTISTLAGGIAPATPASATSVSTGGPLGVAVDGSGNVYFSSQLNCVFKIAAGTVTRIAGTCRPGFSGDGGSAASAQLNGPAGIAVDSSGNLYVADRNNYRIRKVSSGGTITTVAGNGTQGYSGDNGQATSAQINAPAGIAVDSSGNLYIADSSNHVIRKVSGGVITTIAGTGVAGFGGDSGTATAAQLNTPSGVAVDSSGNVYIADLGNNRIRKVSGGNITTIAGSGVQGYSGDGGSAVSASLWGPAAVTVDGSGNVYIADLYNARVRWVSGGTIRTLMGTGTAGFSGDGQATAAQVNAPAGLAVDASNNVFVADSGNYRVREVSGFTINSPGTTSTIGGNGTAGFSGDGASAGGAQLALPLGVARDSSGNIYIADQANNRIRKVTAGGTIATFAGTGVAGFSGDGGQATSAQLNSPSAVAVDSSGDVFVADTGNQRIREILTNGVIMTVAGNGTPGYNGDSISATTAQLNNPLGVAVDASGNVYISDTVNSRIREVIGGTIYTIAGTGVAGYRVEGTATGAQVNFPAGIALDGSGNLYIADRFNNRIRKVSSGVISTVAGTGSIGFSGDGGAATSAALTSPYSVAVDGSGNLFIADAGNNRVRYVSSGGTISTIAGSGVAGFTGDGGPAASAGLDSPAGVAVDPSGKVYVAEAAGNDVRVLTGVAAPQVVSVTPSSGSGNSQTFTFLFTDPNGGGDAGASVMINSGINGANACWVWVSAQPGTIWLMNDSGQNWLPSSTLGAGGTLQNSQCTINLAQSSGSISANTYTLHLSVVFAAGFAGAKGVYGYVTESNNGPNSGWVQLGSWTVTTGTSQPPGTLRINAGGGAYSDSLGNSWSADSGFQGGATYNSGAAIAGTSDSTLYQTVRYNTGGPVVYQVSVPNGSYTVTLKFAEPYFTSSGSRVFNVALNGTTVQSNLDVFAASGGIDRALDLSFPVTVSGGQITVTLTAVVAAPMVSAIQVVPSSAAIRVNAGASSYTDSHGNVWSADTGFQGGTTYASGASVSGTSDGTLYQSVRYNASGPVVYQFGVANGNYTVTLKFAEPYYTSNGKRVFDIALNGTTVWSGLDVFAVTGGINRALDLAFPVSVSGGQITITLTGQVAAPMVSAIDIEPFTTIFLNAGGSSYTDSTGNTWSGDSGFQGGTTYNSGAAISGTSDGTLYQSVRYNASGPVVYQFAVPNGSHNVTLKFAEPYYTSSGKRVFDIALNGTTVQSGLDVFAASGGINRALDLSFPVNVSGGQITITLTGQIAAPMVSATRVQ